MKRASMIFSFISALLAMIWQHKPKPVESTPTTAGPPAPRLPSGRPRSNAASAAESDDMTDITNLRDTIVPRSDQINAEQLLGDPMTITVTNVRRGSTAEQPVIIDHDADPSRPYKPCKTMRKVLVALWGEDGRRWIGQSMVLFCDPAVKWGGVMVGGIRISHMTGIDRDTTLSLTETKGRKQAHLIKRLVIERRADPIEQTRADLELAADNGLDALKTAWAALPKPVQRAIGADGLAALKQRAEDEAAKRAAIDHPPESSAGALDALNAAAGAV